MQNQLRFVVDVTDPAKPELQVEGRDSDGRVPFDQPLRVRLSGVGDLESGVVSIEAGCKEEKLTKVWPPLPGPPIFRETTIRLRSLRTNSENSRPREGDQSTADRVCENRQRGGSQHGREPGDRVLRPAKMSKESAEPVPFSVTL